MRHAKSSWDDQSLKDFDRPLNKRGHRDAPAMGRYLADLDLLPDLIISSPAKRAVQTVEHVAGQLGYSRDNVKWVEDLYFKSSDAYLQAIQSTPDDCRVVLIAGHNPSVERIISQLSEGVFHDRVTTANIACFLSGETNWKEISPKNCTFKWLMRPKELKRK